MGEHLTGTVDVSTILVLTLAVFVGLIILVKIVNDVDFGLWLIILFFPFTQLRVIDLSYGSLQPSQLLVVLTLISLALRSATKRDGLEITATPINKAVLIFVLISVFSLVQFFRFDFAAAASQLPFTRSGRVEPIARASTTIINMLLGIATFYLITSRLKTAAAVKKGIVFWLFSGLAASIFGIYAFVGSMVRFLPPLPSFLAGGKGGIVPRELDMMNPLGSPLMPRVASVLQEPRHLAIFLAPIIFFSLILLKNKIYLLRPWVQFSALSLTVVAFTLTFSRITFVLTGAIIVAFTLSLGRSQGYLQFQKPARAAVWLILLPVPFLIAINFLLSYLFKVNVITFTTIQWASVTAGERLSYFSQQLDSFSTAWKMFLDHPILGGGIGSYYYFVKIYGMSTDTAVVNNVYLEVMAETGILGIGSFAFILVSFLKGLRLPAITEEPALATKLISGFKGSFFILLVGYIFLSAFFYPFVWGMMGLAVACKLHFKEPPVGEDADARGI